jgi:hypothetical protein
LIGMPFAALSVLYYKGITTDGNAYIRSLGDNSPIPSRCTDQRPATTILRKMKKGITALFGPLDRDPVTFRLLNSGNIEIDQRFPSLSIKNSNLVFEAASEYGRANAMLSFSFTQDTSEGYPADFIIFTEDQRVSDVKEVVGSIQNYFDGEICGRIFIQMDTNTLSGLTSQQNS